MALLILSVSAVLFWSGQVDSFPYSWNTSPSSYSYADQSQSGYSNNNPPNDYNFRSSRYRGDYYQSQQYPDLTNYLSYNQNGGSSRAYSGMQNPGYGNGYQQPQSQQQQQQYQNPQMYQDPSQYYQQSASMYQTPYYISPYQSQYQDPSQYQYQYAPQSSDFYNWNYPSAQNSWAPQQQQVPQQSSQSSRINDWQNFQPGFYQNQQQQQQQTRPYFGSMNSNSNQNSLSSSFGTGNNDDSGEISGYVFTKVNAGVSNEGSGVEDGGDNEGSGSGMDYDSFNDFYDKKHPQTTSKVPSDGIVVSDA